MSAVVDFVSDAVGGVVEAVGDVVEGVGDALSDVGDWIGENIIEPIKNDPLTFIASAVAYAYGIPGLSFAGAGTAASVGIATTGSKMLQGEDFDDALKAGALAFAGTGVTNAISQGISTGGKDWAPNLYSTADELAAASAAKSATSSATAPGDKMVQAASTPDVVPDTLPGGPLGPDDMAYMYEPSTPYNTSASTVDDALAQANKAGDLAQVDELSKLKQDISQRQAYDPLQEVQPNAQPTQTPSAKSPYKSTLEEFSKQAYPDEVPGRVPIEERSLRMGTDEFGNPMEIGGGTPVDAPVAGSRTGWDAAKNLGEAALETAGSWIWDGAKWVWQNPELALAGAAGLSYLLGDKGGPPDQGASGKDADRQKLDQQFYSDLDQLVLDRQKRDSLFDRDQNPYESGIYTYAEKGPEHEFFTPTIYTPASEYSSSKTVNAAQGGSIGALNAQLPSYYRYGQMPMNMAQGGYASGGLRSVRQDGRSDHIPAMLSDGEFVVDAETVALLGNGSNKAGANRLEQMRQDVRRQKGGALSKGQFSPNAKSPLSYMKRR